MACTFNAATAIRTETLEKIADGNAKMTPWSQLQHNYPPGLKISPAAMVLHKSQSYWMILDLSFVHNHSDRHTPSVNESTSTSMAPLATMQNLGWILPCLIATLANAPPGSPFLFAKLGIMDGFWWLVVSESDAYNFTFVLPTLSNDPPNDPMTVIPSSIPMGWTLSPPTSAQHWKLHVT